MNRVEMPDILGMAITGALENLYITMPAKVVTYDGVTQKAVVQPDRKSVV